MTENKRTVEAGGYLDLVFCDVFLMRGGKIRKLISYLVEIKAPA